jgi:hypothetical protein
MKSNFIPFSRNSKQKLSSTFQSKRENQFTKTAFNKKKKKREENFNIKISKLEGVKSSINRRRMLRDYLISLQALCQLLINFATD